MDGNYYSDRSKFYVENNPKLQTMLLPTTFEMTHHSYYTDFYIRGNPLLATLNFQSVTILGYYQTIAIQSNAALKTVVFLSLTSYQATST